MIGLKIAEAELELLLLRLCWMHIEWILRKGLHIAKAELRGVAIVRGQEPMECFVTGICRCIETILYRHCEAIPTASLADLQLSPPLACYLAFESPRMHRSV